MPQSENPTNPAKTKKSTTDSSRKPEIQEPSHPEPPKGAEIPPVTPYDRFWFEGRRPIHP